MIIVKGKHSVLEALQSGINVHEIMLLSSTRQPDVQAILNLAKQQSIPVHHIDKKTAQKRFNLDNHQQVLAKIQDIPLSPLNTLTPDKHPIVVALDHLEDPFNVGAIMRTCVGLGVSAVILPKHRQAPLSSGVIKASSGAAYHLTIIQVSNMAQALKDCDKKGYWIYATDSHSGTPLQDSTPQSPCVLVMGNEHKGISRVVKQHVHDFISIPMKGHLDSLNVSVSTGIILHHFMTS